MPAPPIVLTTESIPHVASLHSTSLPFTFFGSSESCIQNLYVHNNISYIYLKIIYAYVRMYVY